MRSSPLYTVSTFTSYDRICRLPVVVGPDAIVSVPEKTAEALATFWGSESFSQEQAAWADPSTTTTVISPRSRTTSRRRTTPIRSQAVDGRQDARHAVLVVGGCHVVGGVADGGVGVGHGVRRACPGQHVD